MNHYFTTDDITDLPDWLERGRALAQDPTSLSHLGVGKTICLLFFNNSLRTRLSTQKAARNLGLEVMVMNVGSDGWNLEFEDGVRMDGGTAEHIREAAGVVAQYADLIGIRAFPGLKDRDTDLQERVLKGFMEHSGIPVLNMESATAHPLQALADALTVDQFQIASDTQAMHSGGTSGKLPKVVLSWAPHPRALPHAVPNSFLRIFRRMPVELVVTHPEGYELSPWAMGELKPTYDQAAALKDADFVYVKNWSSYTDYGKILTEDPSWMMTAEKLGHARFMHCLPVRRNVVVEDAVLDGSQTLIMEQAANRTVAASLALSHMLR